MGLGPLVSILIYVLYSIASPIHVLDRTINFDPTRNELIDSDCKPIIVVFARGTLELGNVGTLAGPPFFDALSDILGESNVAVQGVDYGATIPGYLEGGDPEGASTLASLANLAAQKCPQTNLVLSGYSQGAQVVHLGVKQISAEVASLVKAVVLFGDPYKDQPMPNIDETIVDTFCFADDLICDDLPIVDIEHLEYSEDASAASSFVRSVVDI